MLGLFNFHEDQILMDFVGFLSMIIYEVLYTVFVHIKAGLKYTQELKYMPGSAAD